LDGIIVVGAGHYGITNIVFAFFASLRVFARIPYDGCPDRKTSQPGTG